jgi:hypothetical protein
MQGDSMKRIVLGFWMVALLPQQSSSQQLKQAAELIHTADLQADLSFLASKDLAGRNAGSLEDHVATEFIASEFRRLGLKPAGDNGSYFQKLTILTGDYDAAQTTMTAKIAGVEQTFKFNQDFRSVRQSIRNTSACGNVAFAGYGIDAPQYGYSDFSNFDVKGKVVLALAREPQANDPKSKLMGALDTYHAFNWHKVEELRKRGAAALLLITGRDSRVVKQTPASSPRPGGGPSFALEGEMWDLPVFSVSAAIADQLLKPSGKTVETLQTAIEQSLKPSSIGVPETSVCISKAFNNVQKHEGRNVVALLEGSDSNLKAETIIVTAHHDHMGTSNGHIYYGADDNASGVAGMLGAARALVRGNVRPRRSVLFIAYDAEERIFLGSYYYVTHPIVPLNRTVATLNLDMIGRDENDANWPVPADGNVNMVNVLGTRYNPGLRRILEQQNEQIGLKLDYKMDAVDPDSLWSRSDHFWFATLHIPQVEFQTGLHPDYHTENDTWERINYPKLLKITRLVFLAIANLGNSSEKLEFNVAGAPVTP